MFDANGDVAEVVFVAQVSEVDLVKSDGQVFGKRADLKGIERQMNRRTLLSVFESEIDDVSVKAKYFPRNVSRTTSPAVSSICSAKYLMKITASLVI